MAIRSPSAADVRSVNAAHLPKAVFAEWDINAPSAECQHQGCIGCEKRSFVKPSPEARRRTAQGMILTKASHKRPIASRSFEHQSRSPTAAVKAVDVLPSILWPSEKFTQRRTEELGIPNELTRSHAPNATLMLLNPMDRQAHTIGKLIPAHALLVSQALQSTTDLHIDLVRWRKPPASDLGSASTARGGCWGFCVLHAETLLSSMAMPGTPRHSTLIPAN